MTPALLRVTVMRNRFVNGWPGHEQGERVHNVPLHVVLMRKWTSDAHFTQYVTPNGRRLSTAALQHFPIEFPIAVFEADCSAVHKTGQPAPESWRAEQQDRLQELLRVHPGGFLYFTRAGWRIVYLQPKPAVLRSDEDARLWRRRYIICAAYFKRRFGLDVDPSCGDAVRLFRAPFVVRDGKPQRFATFGDTTAIGALQISATAEDVRNARVLVPTAWDEPRQYEPRTDGDGKGLLWHLLNARRHIGRARRGGWVITCPNAEQHTTPAGTSTILFPAAHGEEIGAIKCWHASCQGKRARDWIGMFGDAELESARASAGIVRPAKGRAA